MKTFKNHEEYVRYIMQHPRLTKKCYDNMRLDYYTECDELSYDDEQLLIDKLGMYEDAEQEHRLFILPCHAGDKMYYLTNNNTEVVSGKIEEIRLKQYGTTFICTGNTREFSLKELGLIWFLSEDNAKKKTEMNKTIMPFTATKDGDM